MIALYGWVRSFCVTVIGVRFGFGVFRIGLVPFAAFRFVLAVVQRFQCVFNLLSGAEADTGAFDTNPSFTSFWTSTPLLRKVT